MSADLLVPAPRHIPWLLRPALWVAARLTGKDPLPGRLLAWFPKGAIGAGVFELTAAHGPKDLDARTLAVVRIVASGVVGCPFCIDMNAASWRDAGITADELEALLAVDLERVAATLSPRELVAARYSRALSCTPVALDDHLRSELAVRFTPRELVVLATTIGQVNYWSRFNQGLGVPAAGFFDESVCRLPVRRA